MIRCIFRLAAIGVALLACIGGRREVLASKPVIQIEVGHAEEVRLLPKESVLQPLSLGYRTALADIVWFSAINYFGKRIHGTKDYRWLMTYCRSVTTLDPRGAHYYPFCSLMIAFEVNEPEGGIEILKRGEQAFPDSWFYPYLIGIIRFNKMNDIRGAQAYLDKAAQKPGASPAAGRLALALRDKAGEPLDEQSIADLLDSIPDASTRSAMESKLRELQEKRAASSQKPYVPLVLAPTEEQTP